jgi:hypothetical protein
MADAPLFSNRVRGLYAMFTGRRGRIMALFHVLARFVCGRSLRKRRVDQHKRMQLILGPRWLLSPSPILCSRTYPPDPIEVVSDPL